MDARLSGWLLDPAGSQVGMATQTCEKLDAWFSGDVGADWRGDGALGLGRALDVTPGWDWSTSDKLASLAALVDDVRNRVRLVPPGHPLAAALDGVWGGASWRADGPAGLAQALDQLPGWQSWATPGLTLDTLHSSLTPLPGAWTGGEATALNDDQETGLKYDDANWYLSDGRTIVVEDQAHPGYFYDAAGNWYHKGQPSSPPSDRAADTAPTATDLTVEHFDERSGRWRRKYGNGDDDFEYYNDSAGTWERFHSDEESAQGLKEAVEEAIQNTLEELQGQGELPDEELAAIAEEALRELLDAFTD